MGAGLINSEQIMAYADTPETGLPQDRIAYGLSSAWDIRSPEDAAERLSWLIETGDRFVFELAYQAYDEAPAESREDDLFRALAHSGRYPSESALAAAYARARLMLTNVADTYRLLKDPVNGPYVPNHYKQGILAWDLGRLVTLARMCSDLGHIDERERDRIIQFVGAEVTTNFTSWPIFARGYILGRAAIGGQGVMLEGIIGIASDAMTDKKSPWVLSPL
ncbi:hypothetical protein ASE14_12000 [Agromyces sp. Root81]|nr:hypothetical protein ASE14_12000 [Agromyces sp. Root81]